MSSEHITREFEAYRKDDAEATAILDLAGEENRSVTPEEDERFDRLFDSARSHKVRAEKLTKMDDDSKSLAEAVRSRIGDITDAGSGAGDGPSGTSDQRIAEEIRSIVSEHKRNLASQDTSEHWIEAKVNLDDVRAIADFSDNGALYTTEFSTKVAVYQRTVSPWINLAYVINADNGRPLNLPNLTVDPTTYTPGEGTAITEATPTIGSAALTTTAYKALSYISQEAEEDELIGLLGHIAKSQGRSIGLAFGSALTTAVVAAATNGGTANGLGGASTATFFGYEDLLDLKYGAAVPYRQVGVWIMSNGAIKKARKFRDTVGQYLWQPAIAQGQPDLLDGQPVYEDPYLVAPASVTKSVLYGDASAVVIKQMALRIATSGDYRFNTDQIALKTVYRAGAALPDAAAIRYLISANS